jgi:hypothetical protein
MAGTNLLRIIESARGLHLSLKRHYSTFAYTTLLQLSGRVGRAYNRGYYGRYPVTVVGEVAWTTKHSRGTS